MDWQRWTLPILASLTAVLDAVYLAHLIGSGVIVLVSAVVTAIVAIAAALALYPEQHKPPAEAAAKKPAAK